MENAPDTPQLKRYRRALVLKLMLLVGLIVSLHFIIDWALARAAASASAEMLTAGLIAALVLAYAILIAIPFVPGIEIGLALLALRGSEVAPIVYLATVAGLMLAYVAGCKLPLHWLRIRLDDLRFDRAARFIREIEPMSPQRRLTLLRSRLPGRVAPYAVKWRYVGLALLVNMPGSGLIGGGGGICLLAGLTGLFTPRATLVTLALAVAPLPLLVWFSGMEATWMFSPH